MALIDLIVLVLVVVIIVSRFTKFKLPKDPRDKAARRADLDRLRGRPLLRDDEPKVVDITQAAEVRKSPVAKPKNAGFEAAKNLTGVAKIKALEPSFDEEVFLDGAKAAYGYFYTCWNAKDEEGLANLCAPALFDRLEIEMNDNSWEQVEIDDITSVRVVDARVHGKTAVIDVAFDTVEREGSASPKPVKRTWVLARPLGSEDPNWELEDIKTGADA